MRPSETITLYSYSARAKQKKLLYKARTFLQEYEKKISTGYLVFPGERPRKMEKNITAFPWFKLYDIFTTNDD